MSTTPKTSDELSRFVKVFDDALTGDQCDSIVKYYDEHEDDAVLGSVLSNGEPEIKTSVKNVMQLHVPYQSDVDDIISESCGVMLNRYINSINYYPFSITSDEGYGIKKYSVGENFYDWHIDASEPAIANRVLAMVWYLNDVEEGGETEFDFGLKVKPKKGRILIFPCSFCYPHRGCMPISESKYSIDTFIK